MKQTRAHRAWWLALVAALALIAAACSSDDDETTTDAAADEATDGGDDAAAAADDEADSDEDSDSEAGADDEADDDGATASDEERSLVIYAPWSDERANFVVDAAAEELGIEVEFLLGGGGELTDRLLAEQNNTQADIVLGIGESQINRLAAVDLFQPYLPAWSDKVPESYTNDENLFTMYAQVPVVMSYNAAVMDPADAPTSWTDLADPAYEGMFIMPGLGGQTGQATISGILWRFADPETGEVSDEGWQVLSDIYANQISLGEGESFDPEWIADGTMPIFLSWRGGVANTDADNDSFELTVIDTEGGTPFVVTGVGITQATDSPGVAQEFIDWFGTADFQVRFVGATGNDPPANEDAIPELETAQEWLSGVSRQDIDWSVVTTVLDEWLERIELDIIE